MIRLLMALLVSLAALTGCTSGQTAGSGTGGRITLQQLNQEMIHYTRWQNARALALTSAIEAAAPNDRLRYETTRMKLQILNTQRKLMLAPDPRDIFTDSWVYAVQRRNFLKDNLQAAMFSPWRDEILRNLEDLIGELKRIGGLFMNPDELANAEAAVEAYAGDHPTLGLFDAPAARPSADAKDKGKSDGLGAIVNIPLAPFSAMHGVDAAAAGVNRMADVAERMSVVSEDIPQQFRWQVELLQYDVTHQDPLKTMFEDLSRASESIERVSLTVQSLPKEVRSEVQDVMTSFDEPAKALQLTLRDAKAAADALTATTEGATKLLQSYQETFGAAEAEPGPPPDPNEPSELEQLTTAAEQLRSTVAEARGLVGDLDGLLQDSGAIDGQVRGLVRFVTLQGILLVVAVLAAALLYRVLSSRVIKPR